MNKGISALLKCAQEGRHATASTGEQAAYRIAVALLAIKDDLALVDQDIAMGAGFAVHLLGGNYASSQTITKLLQEATGER